MVYLCDNCNRYPCADDDYKMRYTCPGFLEKPKPMTNADNLRSMTDEELAEFIFSILKGAFVVFGANPTEEIAKSVKQDWLEWLKEEGE